MAFSAKLGDLEQLLAKHQLLTAAAVIQRETSTGDNEVIAFVVENQQASQHQADFNLNKELKRYIRSQSSLFVMPSEIRSLEALPTRRGGGIDIADLTKLLGEEDTYVAPTNVMQTTLCAIWQRILGAEQVGIHDNFFSLGGHSLLATRITSAMRDELAVEVPISILFEAPTVAELEQKIRQKIYSLDLPPLLPADRKRLLKLSYAQQRLWFIDQLGDGSVEYNGSGKLPLPEKLNRAAFEATVRHLIDRHEILRSHIASVDGEPHQVIESSYELPLIYHDLGDGDRSGKHELIKALAQEEANKPFNLDRDLMIRFRLIHLGQQSYVALYTMHHIVSDGWSMQILLEEMTKLYQGYLEDKTFALPELKVQYVDYAQWQRQWLSGELLAKQLDYWKNQLQGIPSVHRLPLDKVRPSRSSYEGRKFTQIFNQNVAKKVQLACESKGVTLFIMMETVFALLISRYSASEEVVIGSPMSGRNHKDLEGLLGFLLIHWCCAQIFRAAPPSMPCWIEIKKLCSMVTPISTRPLNCWWNTFALNDTHIITPCIKYLLPLSHRSEALSTCQRQTRKAQSRQGNFPFMRPPFALISCSMSRKKMASSPWAGRTTSIFFMTIRLLTWQTISRRYWRASFAV